MMSHRKFGVLAGLLAVGCSPAAFAVAQSDDPDLLETIERGLWQLRGIGGAANVATDRLCVADPRQLVQIQHGGAACTQYVVRRTPNSVTISYSCKGAGQGLTTIKRESGKLIQIQSQGIRNSSPFSFSVEGRRAGGC